MLIKESFAKRLMKEKCEPAQCTTGSALKEKKRRQYITGILFVTLSRVVETMYSFLEEGIFTKEKSVGFREAQMQSPGKLQSSRNIG